MRLRLFAVGLGLVLVVPAAVACSSSTPTGPPDCGDTSAAGSRLAAGCVHDGKTYPARTLRCTDGTTLYTVPFTPQDGGASAFSTGKLRARTATTTELEQCAGGLPSTGAPSS